MERRIHKRVRRRMKVRFGEEGFERVAFSSNLSVSGMFVSCTPAPALSTRLHFEISSPDIRTQYVEGIVQRVAHVEPSLRGVVENGFGVRFLSRGEVFNEMNPRGQVGLEVIYAQPADFRAAMTQLQVGGLFLNTQRPVVVNSVLPVRFEFLFTQTSVELQCRVVHVSDAGVGLLFVDTPTALPKLMKAAGKPNP